ncbi:MAG: hypothetical protein KAX49_20010 [Halanaerobiales bacterium]|nr:hypothetical protein [Halanaerobiales bacterium]
MYKSIGILIIISLCLIMIPNYVAAEELILTNSSYIAKSNFEENIAQISLKQVAERERSKRNLIGGTLIATGGGLAVLGVALGEDAIVPLSITGGIVAGAGAVFLALPTDLEKGYKEIMLISDPEDREYASEEFLAYEAIEAAGTRFVSGITNTGLALYYFVWQPNHRDEDYENDMDDIMTGITCGALAAYNFLVPTHIEKVYSRVEDVKERKVNVSFRFGEYTGPVLSFNF